MATRRNCAKCLRLADLYLDRVNDHVTLIEEQSGMIQDGKEDVADIEWRLAQARTKIDEARKRFLNHRSTHVCGDDVWTTTVKTDGDKDRRYVFRAAQSSSENTAIGINASNA